MQGDDAPGDGDSGDGDRDGATPEGWRKAVSRWAEEEAWRPARGGRHIPPGGDAPDPAVFHASGNGDRWLLVHDSGSGQTLVRHQGNAASGGHVTDMAIGAFLDAGHGPEQQALLRLAATPAEDGATG